MIDFEEAKRIALTVPHPDTFELAVDDASEFEDGWMFDWRDLEWEKWVGGPPVSRPVSNFVVHRSDGHVETLVMPSDRAFEVGDMIMDFQDKKEGRPQGYTRAKRQEEMAKAGPAIASLFKLMDEGMTFEQAVRAYRSDS